MISKTAFRPIVVFFTNQIIIRVIKKRNMSWEEYVACMKGKRNALKILVWQPEEKSTLGKPTHTLEDNIKLDFRYMR
jgi:hypothetical protein